MINIEGMFWVECTTFGHIHIIINRKMTILKLDIKSTRFCQLPFLIFVVLFASFPQFIFSQKTSSNIVPNPGFERMSQVPDGWTYSGSDFGKYVKYWFSATTASPDIYGPDVYIPVDWREKGFGAQKAHKGKSMAGVTVYGCTNGKPHCREYVEIQLAEPLVIGQAYYLEYWVTHLDKSLQINNLGAYFSISEIKRTTDEILIREAQVNTEEIIEAPDGKWVKVSGQFIAKYEAEHILIGNFSEDINTKFQAPRDDCYNYAYYYVDDVLLKKIPPFLPVPVKPDDLTLQKFETGKSFLLKSIYFEFDRDELMPRSYVELKKLLLIMRKNPKLKIEIIGHTDSLGADDYNLDLSKRRAESVIKYLTDNKISRSRLQSKGEGERKPIATNETDVGRSQNRRVEFLVIADH